ncbi:MAG: T9SS type A sorting domain-containing protein [Elusimicrobia bacterium]|nr:T9SS type A sorting domain-containing protein [Elusimicrobiota bacterium]
MKKAYIFTIILIACSPAVSLAGIRWQVDGSSICNAENNQENAAIASDGEHGAIIVWQDYRDGEVSCVYAQRIDKDGHIRWTADGVALCNESGDQEEPAIVPDGAGGAIIAWMDSRAGLYDIYAQRVDADGNLKWAAGGSTVCSAAEHQLYPECIATADGGAIITWMDIRGTSSDYDIFVQKLDGDGVPQWTENGKEVTSEVIQSQQYPRIVSDGAGGAIIAWQDFRSASNNDIYAQRVDSSGNMKWTADGVALCANSYNQTGLVLAGDEGGRAVAAWIDARSGTSNDVYAQKIDAAGNVKWTADGVAVCGAAYDQEAPDIETDGSGGAFIVWVDPRDNDGTSDIYMQKVGADGAADWTADGELVGESSETAGLTMPKITCDGMGGVIVTWFEEMGEQTIECIYAQRVDADGNLKWGENGVMICSIDSAEYPEPVSDDAGGAVITWNDGRNTYEDIFAQRISNPGVAIAKLDTVSGVQGETLDITGDGKNFFPTMKATFSGTGIKVNSVEFIKETKIVLNITISDGAAKGMRDLTVTNPDESRDTLKACFEVEEKEAEPEEIVEEEGEVVIVGSEETKGTINPDKKEPVQIYFKGKKEGKYTLRIFTMLGELVYDETKNSLKNGTFSWIPGDLASGIYIIHIEGPGIDIQKKLAILR